MQRRQFIAVLGGAAAWPVVAAAQQPATVGFFSSASREGYAHLVAAFRDGLKERGFLEGQNVRIEYGWADEHLERLPSLVADLIDRHVSVIVASGTPAGPVAKRATNTIPIVFATGNDPVELGLVSSINRPGGNLTGVTYFGGSLGAKRLELLRELVPGSARIAFLANPTNPNSAPNIRDIEAAARAVGLPIKILEAADEKRLQAAFDELAEQHVDGLIVSGDPMFTSTRDSLARLAASFRIPAIYQWPEFVRAGGLISYGVSQVGSYRQVGYYTAEILNGKKPADLPVIQPTKFDLVINLKTAKALNITVPPTLLARADEVIE